MKKSAMAKIGLLAAWFAMSACENSDKEKVCNIAWGFADAYYNLNVRKAESYCSRELIPIMNFRYHNLSDSDVAYRKSTGQAKARVLSCEFVDNNMAYVNVEVSNFIRINYLNDSLSIAPRDTIELTIVKEPDEVWRIQYAM